MYNGKRDVLKRAIQAALLTATPLSAIEFASAQGMPTNLDLKSGGKLQVKPGANPELPPQLILVQGDSTKPVSDGVFELKDGGKVVVEKEKIAALDSKSLIPKEFSLHVRYKGMEKDKLNDAYSKPGAVTLQAKDAELRFLNPEKLPSGTIEKLSTKLK